MENLVILACPPEADLSRILLNSPLEKGEQGVVLGMGKKIPFSPNL